MVIDEELPLEIIANTASVMGMTLGKRMPKMVGEDVFDAEDKQHLGVILVPIPILKGNKALLSELRAKLYEAPFKDIVTVDFSTLAQSCKTYDEYIDNMRMTQEKELVYIGIALCGDKRLNNKLTGSMPLL